MDYSQLMAPQRSGKFLARDDHYLAVQLGIDNLFYLMAIVVGVVLGNSDPVQPFLLYRSNYLLHDLQCGRWAGCRLAAMGVQVNLQIATTNRLDDIQE